jgi:hypothetical protein
MDQADWYWKRNGVFAGAGHFAKNCNQIHAESHQRSKEQGLRFLSRNNSHNEYRNQ